MLRVSDFVWLMLLVEMDETLFRMSTMMRKVRRMFTELLFITLFVTFYVCLSRRSRMIIGVLYSSALVWFVFFRFELWQIHSFNQINPST